VEVTTSVNQSFLRGEVLLKTSAGVKTAGKTEEIPDPIWLLHDHIGYYFPEAGKSVTLKI
jgi:chondroitin AC lyase